MGVIYFRHLAFLYVATEAFAYRYSHGMWVITLRRWWVPNPFILPSECLQTLHGIPFHLYRQSLPFLHAFRWKALSRLRFRDVSISFNGYSMYFKGVENQQREKNRGPVCQMARPMQ